MLDFILRHIIEVERGALLAILITYGMVFLATSGENVRRVEKRLRGLSSAMMLWMALEFLADCYSWWPNHTDWLQNQQLLSSIAHAEFMIVPIAFLTITEITLRRKVTARIALIHCVPFAVMLLLGLIIKNLWFDYVYLVLLIIYASICCTLAARAIRRYEQHIINEYSDLYGLSINWMKYTLISLMLILATYVWHCIQFTLLSRTVLFAIEIGLWTTVGHNIYKMISARENAASPIRMTSREEAEDEQQDEPLNATTSTQRAADIEATKETFTAQLTPTQRQELEQFSKRLQTICEEGKLYKKEDLTRDELANEMGLNHTYFTRMLKAARGLSFYDYINTLRMEDAAELLKDPQFPLDSIPYEIGYRHKSTYYRAFSEHFGCTPKEYRHKLSINN